MGLDLTEILKKVNIQDDNLAKWLATVDPNDDKYDYVTHNKHWLTSMYSDKCELCLKKGPPPVVPKITSSPLVKPSQKLNSPVSDNQKPTEEPLSRTPPNEANNGVKTGVIIPLTPIAPSQIASKPFVTPYTSRKFNDTFSRSTRQSTRKLREQANAEQDLINLNETFDLYKSALAESPNSEEAPAMQDMVQQPIATKIPKIPSRTGIPIRSMRN